MLTEMEMRMEMEFEVLKAKRKGDSWIILCHLLFNEVTPWATWTTDKIDGSGERYWGHYFYEGQEELAHLDFEDR